MIDAIITILTMVLYGIVGLIAVAIATYTTAYFWTLGRHQALLVAVRRGACQRRTELH